MPNNALGYIYRELNYIKKFNTIFVVELHWFSSLSFAVTLKCSHKYLIVKSVYYYFLFGSIYPPSGQTPLPVVSYFSPKFRKVFCTIAGVGIGWGARGCCCRSRLDLSKSLPIDERAVCCGFVCPFDDEALATLVAAASL